MARLWIYSEHRINRFDDDLDVKYRRDKPEWQAFWLKQENFLPLTEKYDHRKSRYRAGGDIKNLVLEKFKMWFDTRVCVNCLVVSDSLDPMGCSLPGSFVHGILQARIQEWVAISFSRGSSWPKDWTRVSCIAGGSSPSQSPRENIK